MTSVRATSVRRGSPGLRAFAVALAVLLPACGDADTEVAAEAEGSATVAESVEVPDVLATNAFYYYRDLAAAHDFYTDIMGFETVADFGFAKVLRIADASYLTLVDEQRGMHSADEPKSVTLAIVTEQVEGWYDYLQNHEVPMRAELRVEAGSAHDGFVAIDPEGYLIEVERFNPHEENVDLMPLLDVAAPVSNVGGDRPAGLDVQATVFWLYYDDIPAAQEFYESLLGVPLLVDQGWAKVYSASRTGYVGLVDGSRGLHQATEEKAVTLSFITSDIDAWFDRATALGVDLRDDSLGDESGRVTTFVAYDSEGYTLEWDTFRDEAGNERILELLQVGGIR